MWLIRYSMPTTGEETAEDVNELSFTAPARGDVFDFDVTVSLAWSAVGRRWQAGPDAAERDHVQGRVRAETRAIARRHSPYQSEDAEREVNSVLDDFLGRLSRHDRRVILRWTARAEVRPSEEVRQLLRDRARRLYQVDCEVAEAKRRAETAEEVRLAWERFLAGARRSDLTRYAVRLAEQPQAKAAIIAEMLDKGEDTAAHFIDKLDKLVSSHRQGDVYELIVGSESALRSAMTALGLAVPPLDPDPLLPSGFGQP
ncbi:hypothetical protein [Microbispora catharanthi]|uniref:Uncharacterized protein n=1 Tax=Microbispora catharanthi TaxID=1712871 RepID=A0A5N6AYX7_9ACTN|nr:hypothetical protein [Microbispora catharanthi]KAB8173774.1 hypothetical protein FH610_041075 [Microbispora catharanthi]